MSTAKDIQQQANGIHPNEPSTSGELTSADDNANLNNDTNNHKGAIPKIKSTKTKLNFSKKSVKLNNNIDDELKCRVKNELSKLNGITNGTSSYAEQQKLVNYDCITDSYNIYDGLDDREETDRITNTKNERLAEEGIDFRESILIRDDASSSSDDDLFSVSDDGCIYTYKGDQVADLPSSFFNLNNLVPLPLQQNEENSREQNSSPEMDFLEMDFDPGPSESSDFFLENDTKPNMEMEAANMQVNVGRETSPILNCIQSDNTDETSKNKTNSFERPPGVNVKKTKELSPKLPSRTLKVTPDLHQKYPWLCPVSERTTSTKDQLYYKRCHFTRGELISPSEKMPIPRICDTLDIVEEAMIWTEEEANSKQVNQIGPSACGATAVLNVLNALRFPIPSLEELNECVKTKLRANTSPLTEYLLSRSVAGTDHNDLIEGLQKLSKNQIYGRFFHMYPERVVNLHKWLSFWIKNGAVPIATLNLQKCSGNIPDAWHHQMIYGVGPKGIFLTNPMDCLKPEQLWPQLCSESVILIRREDVLKRWNIKTDLAQLIKIQDHRWRNLNVVGQVANMIHESERELRRGFINTSHIRIPAAYSSGITLVIKIDAPFCNLLKQCPELPEFHNGDNVETLNENT